MASIYWCLSKAINGTNFASIPNVYKFSAIHQRADWQGEDNSKLIANKNVKRRWWRRRWGKHEETLKSNSKNSTWRRNVCCADHVGLTGGRRLNRNWIFHSARILISVVKVTCKWLERQTERIGCTQYCADVNFVFLFFLSFLLFTLSARRTWIYTRMRGHMSAQILLSCD